VQSYAWGMTNESTLGQPRILVWDLPTRAFHWLLTASVLGAFAISVLADDESGVFPWHMLLGAVAAFLVMLRVVWGLVGSRYARFGSFAFGVTAVLAYAKSIFTGKGERHIGHNPGSSVAIFTMLGLTLGVALTGVLMSTSGEVVKELHEVLAYSLIGVIGAHVLGVIVHTARRRDNITLSMLDGRKQGEKAQAIPSAHPLAAAALLGLTALWSVVLVRGYDTVSRSVVLPGLGTRIALGEAEGPEAGEGDSARPGRGKEDHDDRD